MSLRLPGIGSHHSASAITDEWYTPPEISDSLPPFDLDPCAPRGGPMPWARVDRWHSIDDDGLAQDWHGHVWLNPPYSDIEPWMAALADHGNGIALVFARTETRWWFAHVWPHASVLLFLRGRVTFWRDAETPSRAGANSGGPSVLIAYGSWAAAALVECRLPGALVRPERIAA